MVAAFVVTLSCPLNEKHEIIRIKRTFQKKKV
jgi:hypothetical protein